MRQKLMMSAVLETLCRRLTFAGLQEMKGKEAENLNSSRMENVDNTADRGSVQGAWTEVDFEENMDLVFLKRINQQVHTHTHVEPS